MPLSRSIHPCGLRNALLCAALFAASQAWCASTPARPVAPSSSASGTKEVDAETQIAQMRQEQQHLLMMLKANLESTPASSAERAKKEQALALIERRIADENNGLSRWRYMTPALQAGEVFGPYCAELQHRIEARGTTHFPESNGHKLYGRVVLNLQINSAGRLVDTVLVRGSGNATLDRRARETAAAAAPFGAFGPGMRLQADEIVFTANFNFVRQPDDAASAQGGSAP